MRTLQERRMLTLLLMLSFFCVIVVIFKLTTHKAATKEPPPIGSKGSADSIRLMSKQCDDRFKEGRALDAAYCYRNAADVASVYQRESVEIASMLRAKGAMALVCAVQDAKTRTEVAEAHELIQKWDDKR